VDVAGERPGAAGLASAVEAVPGFYVALELLGDGQCCRPGLPFAPLTLAVVRATATGAALAAVTAPSPYGTFIGMTGAAGNRTFVLAAQKVAQLPLTTPPATRFFLLRIDPDGGVLGGQEPLTSLPVPEQPPGREVCGLALSPDAARLAVTAGRLTAPALRIFSLATGHERVWDGPVGPGYGPGAAYGSLSWDAAGQTLALITSGIGPDSGVRLLDTTAPGSRLLDSSRLVLPSPPRGPENWSGNYWRQVMISADGQTIIAVLQLDGRLGSADRVTQKLVTFSASTGELLHTLNHIPVHGGYQQVLWASPSAQLLIVSGTQPGPTVGSFNLGHSAGTLTGGRFTPLPWSNRTFAAAW
jgi:hypothetical protein